MTKRFCDRCERELTADDDIPFVRVDTEHNVKVSLIVTNLENRPIAEICNNCKVAIITQPLDSKPETLAAISEAPTIESPAKPFTSEAAPIFELCLPPEKHTPEVRPKTRKRRNKFKKSGIVSDAA